jgi:hypothetical protein
MSHTSRSLGVLFVSLVLVSAAASTQEPGGGRTQDEGANRQPDLCDRLPDPPGRARGIEKKCPAGGGSSSGIARGDFNGDGFADLAVGVPGEETSSSQPDSGAVNVIYGSANGLTATDANVPPAQFWSQNSDGVPGGSEAGDGFGSALAAGDFNDDGFSDLAIGAPFDVIVSGGTGTIGVVIVIYGSPAGLATAGDQMVRAAQNWAMSELNDGGQIEFFAATSDADVPPDIGSFGASLAWGDFNGDGVGDLAVGSPREDIGPLTNRVRHAGAVGIILGSPLTATSPGGLTAAGSQVWTQNTDNVLGTAQRDDLFGHALAGGDFNGDKITDLAIGVPLEDVPGTDTQGGGLIQDAGAAQILFGRQDIGLTAANDRFFDETSLLLVADATGVSQAGDSFGASLAAGDFDGNGLDDLAVGAHLRNALMPNRPNAGAVFVDYNGGIGTPVTQFWDQSRIFGDDNDVFEFTGSSTESDDRFGRALAAADFNGDGRDDLAIGVPFEDVVVDRGTFFEEVTNAGAVDVVSGSTAGLASTGRAPQHWHQNVINIEDQVEAGDLFGTSLTAWNFGRNQTRQVCAPIGFPCFNVTVGTPDLAIGVSLENVGNIADAGAVNVIYACQQIGSSCPANGLSAGVTTGEFSDQFWTQTSAGVPDGSEAGDHFGMAVY